MNTCAYVYTDKYTCSSSIYVFMHIPAQRLHETFVSEARAIDGFSMGTQDRVASSTDSAVWGKGTGRVTESTIGEASKLGHSALIQAWERPAHPPHRGKHYRYSGISSTLWVEGKEDFFIFTTLKHLRG